MQVKIIFYEYDTFKVGDSLISNQKRSRILHFDLIFVKFRFNPKYCNISFKFTTIYY